MRYDVTAFESGPTNPRGVSVDRHSDLSLDQVGSAVEAMVTTHGSEVFVVVTKTADSDPIEDLIEDLINKWSGKQS